MKKLMILVCGIAMSYSLSAQEVLEGEFSSYSPARQIWDGTYLLYSNMGKTIVYNVDTKQSNTIDTNETEYLRFKNGFYFLKKDYRYQLWKVGEDEPHIPDEFNQVGNWFGDQILVRKEITEPTRRWEFFWISDTGEIYAKHGQDSIKKAMEIDTSPPKKMTVYEAFGYALSGRSLSISTVYSDSLLALENPKTKLWGYYDVSLNRVIEHRFKGAEPFFEGMAAVQNEEGFWGFIDKSGKEVVPYKFSYKPQPFLSGLALVRDRNYKIGFINRAGELVIPAIYDEASNFYKGYSLAKSYRLGKSWVMIDSTGVEQESPGANNTPKKYYTEFPDKEGYFPYVSLIDMIDKGMGIFNYAGSSMIFSDTGELIYEAEKGRIKNLIDDNFLLIGSNPINQSYIPKSGLMNSKGEWLIEVKRSEF